MRFLLPIFVTLFAPLSVFAQGPASFQLNVDGTAIGALKTANGGTVSASVVSETIGAGAFPKKKLAGKTVESLELGFGLDLNPNLYDTIARSFQNTNPPRFSGQVISVDANGKMKESKEFREAFITQIDFPAMDAAAKEIGELRLKAKPADIQSSAISGTANPSVSKPNGQWRVSNFRLELDGLDTKRIRRIEPIVFKRTNDTLRSPIDFSNLKISIAEAGLPSWKQWFEDFVIKGPSSDDQEKSGAIVLLAPDLRTELARINLKQCGIYRLADSRNADASLVAGAQTAELYCEQMDFVYKR